MPGLQESLAVAITAGVALAASFVVGSTQENDGLAPPGERFGARDGVACPSKFRYADPDRLQKQVFADLEAAAEVARTSGLEAARPLLETAQARLCSLIALSPQRGLSWIQLLSVSPESVAAPASRAALYRLSRDLAPFEMDALRARVYFGMPRWAQLGAEEREVLREDAEIFARFPFDGREAVRLALLGALGGAEVAAELRELVARHRPDAVRVYENALRANLERRQ